MRRALEIALVAACLCSSIGMAQDKNEIGLLFGRTFIAHQTVPGTNFVGNSIAFGNGATIEGNYSRLVRPGDFAAISVEVPVVVDFDEDLNYGMNVVPRDYRSYFVTPSARVTFLPHLDLSPWVSVGGGLAHFSESSTLEFGGSNPGKTGNTTGAFQIGGGLDVTLWRSLRLRADIRDFYTGVPQLNVSTGKSRQSNLFIGVGIVWQFGR